MSLEVFEQTSISPNGAPEILYRFDHAVRRAELSGAVLYAEMRGDGGCDMRIKDATGYVLADLVLNPRANRTITENLMDIGSALLWSHWRFLVAGAVKVEQPSNVEVLP